MGSAFRTSEEQSHPARGLAVLRGALGRELGAVARLVLGLGKSNDECGHGITELSFGELKLVVRPGPNEDYIVVQEGTLSGQAIDREYWSPVDFSRRPEWKHRLGKTLDFVDCYSDGHEDVALVFHLEGGDHFSIVLCDTDLMIAEELEPFERDPGGTVPVFRERLGPASP